MIKHFFTKKKNRNETEEKKGVVMKRKRDEAVSVMSETQNKRDLLSERITYVITAKDMYDFIFV